MIFIILNRCKQFNFNLNCVLITYIQNIKQLHYNHLYRKPFCIARHYFKKIYISVWLKILIFPDVVLILQYVATNFEVLKLCKKYLICLTLYFNISNKLKLFW